VDRGSTLFQNMKKRWPEHKVLALRKPHWPYNTWTNLDEQHP